MSTEQLGYEQGPLEPDTSRVPFMCHFDNGCPGLRDAIVNARQLNNSFGEKMFEVSCGNRELYSKICKVAVARVVTEEPLEIGPDEPFYPGRRGH